MPITQKRMIDLIAAADECNELRMTQLKEFEVLVDKFASGQIPTHGMYAAFNFLKLSFVPSAEAMICIAKEKEHFRLTRARNVRVRDKMRAKRKAEAEGNPLPKGEVPARKYGSAEERGGVSAFDSDQRAQAERDLTEKYGPMFAKGESENTSTMAKPVGSVSEAMAKGNLKGAVEYDDSTPEDPDQF